MLGNRFLLAISILLPLLFAGAEADVRIQWEGCIEEWSWDQRDKEEAELEELSSHVGIGLALSQQLSMQIKAGFANAKLRTVPADDAGEQTREISLSGLLDTQLRLAYRIGDQWLFRVGFNGPTGMTELTPDEITLAQVLGARVLAVEDHRLGQGLDLDTGVSCAMKAGPAAIGLGVGYQLKGAYTLSEDGAEYDPGDQVTLAAGVDLGDPRWLWRSNSRLVLYGSDLYESEELYQTANRYEIQTMLLRRWSATSLWGSVSFMTYGPAKILDEAVLTEEEKRSHGDELYCDVGLQHRLSARTTVQGTIGARVFAGNELEEGQAARYDVGLGLRLRLTRSLAFDARGRYSTGRLEEPAPELGSTGNVDLRGTRVKAALIADF